MPTRELTAYIAHMPRIRAMRALDHAQQVAVGTGRLRPSDHDATLAQWRRDLSAGLAAIRPRDPAEIAAAANAAGIGFRVVHRAPAT